MITKKGSHVGIVLSFVFFVTFIMFFYIMVQPALATENKRAVLDILKENIIEMASAELTSVSVLINSEDPQLCVQLIDFFNKVEIGNRVIIRNNEGEVLDAKISGQDLFVERDGNEIFLKIYGSEEFSITETGTMSSCKQLSEGSGGYILGLIKTTTEIFETKILYIIERHENDYQDLKQDLSVPAGNGFGLDFIYANETSISTTNTPVGISTFAGEFPVKYVTEDSAMEMGILRIKIW